MYTERLTGIDQRKLKNGQMRLRFKLSDRAYSLVTNSIKMTGYKYRNAAVDAICHHFLSSEIDTLHSFGDVHGKNRLLVKLYEDEFEIFCEAILNARDMCECDVDAFVRIFLHYALSELEDETTLKYIN